MRDKADKLIRGLLFNGAVAVTVVSGRMMVENARKAHYLSRVCSAALGRTLLQAAMMSCDLKNDEDRLTCIISGGGAAGNIVCSAASGYRVKGYIENPVLELPPTNAGKLDVASAIGSKGDITVVRYLSSGEPYIGKSALVTGEIAEDFANYYVQSEQRPCLVYLGVRLIPETGECSAAGGINIMPLPGCNELIIDVLQYEAEIFSRLSAMLETQSLDACANELFGNMEFAVLEEATPVFECDCSRERLEGVLIALGTDELEDMAEKDRGAKMQCRFCNTEYVFSEQSLRALIERIREERAGEQK